jgi:hypothetical protein
MTKNCFAAFSRLRVFSLTLLRYSLIAIAGSFVLIPAAEAALLQNVPITLRQPDGTVVRCFVTGDEYHNYIHDRQGDVAVQDPKSRYWVYAKQVNGHIQPGKQTVGRAQSKSSGVPGARALRLQPNRARFYDAHAVSEGIEAGFGHAMNAAVGKPAFPTTGTVNNIVVFVRFSDDPEFNAAIAEYSSLFNADSHST